MLVLDVHQVWAWVTVVGNGVVGAWATAAHWLPVLRRKALMWAVGAAWVSMFVQVVLGVLVITVDDIEAPEFHLFYGFVAILSIGLIYSYRSQVEPWKYLLYGLGTLFIMGLGIRAMFLA